MPKIRPEHSPVGDPCVICRQSAKTHRVDHKFGGDNPKKCSKCGLPTTQHRLRNRNDKRARIARAQKRQPSVLYVGMDGEGQGRERHNYVLLACANEEGDKHWEVSDPEGLSTDACLWFIYSLPRRAKVFTYSFGYDLTKILQDMTLDEVGKKALYELFRPEIRQRIGKEAIKGPRPVKWGGWLLNLQGTKFTISRADDKRARKRVIWDIWKFYQGKFTKALKDWKIGTPEERALIAHMKDRRNEFDKESPEDVLGYCLLECRKMAELARRLIDAHLAAGLPLKSFYGAGSTASVMLEQMGVRKHITKPPEEMRIAVASAFAGGRFEQSMVGCVRQPVKGWDISSAYPYQCCLLPCLAHGRWEHTTDRKMLERCKHALVHYGMVCDVTQSILERPWGPFPFRTPEGSITYPAYSAGGWVWQDEYKEGERLFPQVYFREAWIWRPECECMPFLQLPNHYIERCRIGKEGPGIVLKLGCNSCYGKVAQSVGNGRYNSWVWAGMITSGCRAQGLHLLGLHKDWSNLLMFATDGILTLEDIKPPPPVETGTAVEFTDDKGNVVSKPLGGWEYKPNERGVFLARPGVYFPLDPEEKDLEELRGRGVGRGVVLENAARIVETWENWSGYGHWPTVKLKNVDRFCGAKTSVTRSKNPDTLEWQYNVASGNHLARKPQPRYGEWVKREVAMSFDPMPKRSGIHEDKRTLRLRHPDERIDESRAKQQLRWDVESAPYKKAVVSEEARQLMQLMTEISEQPHGDLGEYELTV